MEDDFIDIEWWRDAASRFRMSDDGQRIIWCGSQPLIRYRPFRDSELKRNIIDDLGAVTTPDQALKFVQRYGFLAIQDGEQFLEHANEAAVMKRHREGEPVAQILAFAEGIRAFTGSAAKPRDFYDALKLHGRGLLMQVELWLEPDDKTKGVRLRYSVWTLHKAIVLLAMRALTGGGAARICENKGCGRPFRIGPWAKRGKKSKFCSDECKTEFFSLNRSKGGGHGREASRKKG